MMSKIEPVVGPPTIRTIQELLIAVKTRLGVPLAAIGQGQAPFTWQLGGESFRILRLGPIGVGGKVYLIITQELSPWPQDSGADLKNRQSISEVKRAFPEYAAVFAGLVTAAQEKDGNRGFRTVDDAPLHPPN
jgi:hypothetical protein